MSTEKNNPSSQQPLEEKPLSETKETSSVDASSAVELLSQLPLHMQLRLMMLGEYFSSVKDTLQDGGLSAGDIEQTLKEMAYVPLRLDPWAVDGPIEYNSSSWNSVQSSSISSSSSSTSTPVMSSSTLSDGQAPTRLNPLTSSSAFFPAGASSESVNLNAEEVDTQLTSTQKTASRG